jgi:hypothetical protein
MYQANPLAKCRRKCIKYVDQGGGGTGWVGGGGVSKPRKKKVEHGRLNGRLVCRCRRSPSAHSSESHFSYTVQADSTMVHPWTHPSINGLTTGLPSFQDTQALCSLPRSCAKEDPLCAAPLRLHSLPFCALLRPPLPPPSIKRCQPVCPHPPPPAPR